jgi:hypothetical protein
MNLGRGVHATHRQRSATVLLAWEGTLCPHAKLTAADVLHPVSRDGVTETDFGRREFATLDAEGNLIEFFRWVR